MRSSSSPVTLPSTAGRGHARAWATRGERGASSAAETGASERARGAWQGAVWTCDAARIVETRQGGRAGRREGASGEGLRRVSSAPAERRVRLQAQLAVILPEIGEELPRPHGEGGAHALAGARVDGAGELRADGLDRPLRAARETHGCRRHRQRTGRRRARVRVRERRTTSAASTPKYKKLICVPSIFTRSDEKPPRSMPRLASDMFFEKIPTPPRSGCTHRRSCQSSGRASGAGAPRRSSRARHAPATTPAPWVTGGARRATRCRACAERFANSFGPLAPRPRARPPAPKTV